jgi:hypothetical protein
MLYDHCTGTHYRSARSELHVTVVAQANRSAATTRPDRAASYTAAYVNDQAEQRKQQWRPRQAGPPRKEDKGQPGLQEKYPIHGRRDRLGRRDPYEGGIEQSLQGLSRKRAGAPRDFAVALVGNHGRDPRTPRVHASRFAREQLNSICETSTPDDNLQAIRLYLKLAPKGKE